MSSKECIHIFEMQCHQTKNEDKAPHTDDSMPMLINNDFVKILASPRLLKMHYNAETTQKGARVTGRVTGIRRYFIWSTQENVIIP